MPVKDPNKEPEMTRYRGGSPECIESNLDYFTRKLKEQHESNIKMTFREWLKRILNLVDLID